MHVVNKDAAVPADLCVDTGLRFHPGYNQRKVRFAGYGTGEAEANPLLAQNELHLTVEIGDG